MVAVYSGNVLLWFLETLLFVISACTPQADIVFMLDSSGSIWFNNRGNPPNPTNPPDFEVEKNFVINVIEGLGGRVGRDAIQIGLILFGTDATDTFYLNRYQSKGEAEAAVRAVQYLGTTQQTNMVRAFDNLRNEQFNPNRGDRSAAPNIAIIVTDGKQVRNISSILQYVWSF